MGQLLSQPITEKHITCVQHDNVSHAVGEMQGYRMSMEDAFCDNDEIIFLTVHDRQLLTKIMKYNEAHGHRLVDPGPAPSSRRLSMTLSRRRSTSSRRSSEESSKGAGPITLRYHLNVYGVYDGHGGSSTSQFVAAHIPSVIRKSLEHATSTLSDSDKCELAMGANPLKLINFPRIMKDIYMNLDSMYYQCTSNNSGSTGVTVLIVKDYVIVTNTGDSRCVLSADGAAKNLSLDHKPKNLGELMRIHNDGGYVAGGRVNSILALSRAFGDYNFKMFNSKDRGQVNALKHHKKVVLTPPEEYQVTVEPDIFIRRITRTDEFLIIACDGIWDCYKPQTLVHLIRHELSLGKNLTEITEMVLDSCIGMANTITGIGFDNMTMLIVALHQDRAGGLHEWYDRVKNRVLDEKFGKTAH